MVKITRDKALRRTTYEFPDKRVVVLPDLVIRKQHEVAEAIRTIFRKIDAKGGPMRLLAGEDGKGLAMDAVMERIAAVAADVLADLINAAFGLTGPAAVTPDWVADNLTNQDVEDIGRQFLEDQRLMWLVHFLKEMFAPFFSARLARAQSEPQETTESVIDDLS